MEVILILVAIMIIVIALFVGLFALAWMDRSLAATQAGNFNMEYVKAINSKGVMNMRELRNSFRPSREFNVNDEGWYMRVRATDIPAGLPKSMVKRDGDGATTVGPFTNQHEMRIWFDAERLGWQDDTRH